MCPLCVLKAIAVLFINLSGIPFYCVLAYRTQQCNSTPFR